MCIKAVCFDLYGTLAVVENAMTEAQASEFLVSRGYNAYPQALKAAWHYVSFSDYPSQEEHNKIIIPTCSTFSG